MRLDYVNHWCRTGVCTECDDDNCDHDCHFENEADAAVRDKPPRRGGHWIRVTRRCLIYMTVFSGLNALVELTTSSALRPLGYVTTLVVSCFIVLPWIGQWIDYMEKR